MATESAKTQRSGTRLRRRGLFPLASLVAVLTLASVLALSPLLQGGQHTAAAATALRKASRTARLQPAPVLRPGQYAFTKSEGAYFDEMDSHGHVWGVLARTTREIWIGADRSGRIRQQSQPAAFLAPGDRARWKAAGSPPMTVFSENYDRHFGPGGLSYPLDIDGFNQADLLRLANDPDALAATIRKVAENNSNPLGWEMLVLVSDLLGESAAPPALRAGLFQVAAEIPGIELIGPVTDRAGRHGIAVAASRDDQQHELIFDPKTSGLLAVQDTLRHPISDTTAPAGTVIDYTLYLGSRITSHP